MVNEDQIAALDVAIEQGEELVNRWHFDWPSLTAHAAARLRLHLTCPGLPSICAIVGGASSGKSTVFNNLLGWHQASRVTAKGHATVGPVLAVHESLRDKIDPLLHSGQLFPRYRSVPTELEGDTCGEPDAIALVYHTVEDLRGIILLDTPDFSSDASMQEGDIALSLFPWFDRLVVVVDHERWFDRQSIADLRAASVRFDQQRMVLFNRTQEGQLESADRAALIGQAQRIDAGGHLVLEYRRGRGFRRFAPGTLEPVHDFLEGAAPDRSATLRAYLGDEAERILAQNEEREVRFEELRQSLTSLVEGAMPCDRDCMIALMSDSERLSLEPVSRILRLEETKRWLTDQTRRIHQALGRVPLLGAALGVPRRAETAPNRSDDRIELAIAYVESMRSAHCDKIDQALRRSRFWHEVSAWTGCEPVRCTFEWDDPLRAASREAAGDYQQALEKWVEKVSTECEGVNTHVRGALGVGAISLFVLLAAVPGPMTALTLISAKGALAGGLSQLLAATGLGALFGKQLAGFSAIVQERLLPSRQFQDLQNAAGALRNLIEADTNKSVQRVLNEARAMIIPQDNPLRRALKTLRDASEGAA